MVCWLRFPIWHELLFVTSLSPLIFQSKIGNSMKNIRSSLHKKEVLKKWEEREREKFRPRLEAIKKYCITHNQLKCTIWWWSTSHDDRLFSPLCSYPQVKFSCFTLLISRYPYSTSTSPPPPLFIIINIIIVTEEKGDTGCCHHKKWGRDERGVMGRKLFLESNSNTFREMEGMEGDLVVYGRRFFPKKKFFRVFKKWHQNRSLFLPSIAKYFFLWTTDEIVVVSFW